MMPLFPALSPQHYSFASSSRQRNFVAKIEKFRIFREINKNFVKYEMIYFAKFRCLLEAKIQCCGDRAGNSEISSTTLDRESTEVLFKSCVSKPWKDFLIIVVTCSVAELHAFYAAPAPGENFDAAPAARLLPYCIARQIFKTN
jgi:hypothetical protein